MKTFHLSLAALWAGLSIHSSPLAMAAPAKSAEAKGKTASAADQPSTEINPPFGLFWMEQAERLERKILNTKARVTEKRVLPDGRDAWTVEGIKQNGLRRTLFYFRRGELVGVELQYQPDGWDQVKYDNFMGQMRQALDRRYGAGQLIARNSGMSADISQILTGYKWNKNNVSVELFFFSAANTQHVFRTLSVHYRLL